MSFIAKSCGYRRTYCIYHWVFDDYIEDLHLFKIRGAIGRAAPPHEGREATGRAVGACSGGVQMHEEGCVAVLANKVRLWTGSRVETGMRARESSWGRDSTQRMSA